jgi:hypothetical protein
MAKNKKKASSRCSKSKPRARARTYAQYLVDHFHAWEEEIFARRDQDRDDWLAEEVQA